MTKTDEKIDDNPTLTRIRSFVSRERAFCDEAARGVRHDLDQARVREDEVGHAQSYLDLSARGVETCDVVLGKLAEVEEEL